MQIKTLATFSVSLSLQALLISPPVSAKLGGYSKPTPKDWSRAKFRPHRPGALLDIHGKREEDPEGRDASSKVIGGTDVPSPGVYPFFVSWGGICGGSLIRSDIVLTAAHCVEVLGINDVVTVNAYTLGSSSTEGAEIRSVSAFSIHPEYNYDTNANDFLLLKLKNGIDTIEPIELNDDSSVPATDQNLTVIGLGVDADGFQPDTLQEVIVKTVSDSECNSNYEGSIDPDVMLCAGVEGGGKDSCYGDSGGPLFVTSSGKVDKQVGVVSWGADCALPDFPGVYAEVSSAQDWILTETCKLSDDKPDNCPEPPPPPGDTVMTLEILTDLHPYEIGWHLLDDTGTEIAGADAGDYQLAFRLISSTISLEKGREYTFNMTDSYGDGMFYPAYYEVKLGDQIVASGAQFEHSDETVFKVPGTPDSTPSPTPQPTPPDGGPCTDNDDTFFADSEAGFQTCEWLKDNEGRYSYLCQFVDVAMVCPDTCDYCEVFG